MSKKTIVRNYDNVSDFIADINQPKAGVANNSHRSGDSSFFWTDTYGEAESLFAKGWSDGVARVAKHREGLAAWLDAAKTAASRQFGYDVSGFYVDVGRALSGEPECFGVEFDNGNQTSAKVVSIRLNACVSGCITAATIAARGIAVLVAVDLLESCGIRCEVIVSQGTETSALQIDGNVVVKKPGEAVDPDRLAFCVAHPSFFRRFGFRFMELYGHSPSGCHPCRLSDYGSRDGAIEIDEILSSVTLDDDSIKENVIEIARKCGLSFTDEQIAELAAA